jgi:hypothetical protein
MLTAHHVNAFLVIGMCLISSGLAFLALRRGAGATVSHALALAQTLIVAQVALGLLLLSDDRRATDELHYAYGSLSLAAILAPWLYAPAEGPRRLLWFAGTSALAAALAVRAFMTGS